MIYLLWAAVAGLACLIAINAQMTARLAAAQRDVNEAFVDFMNSQCELNFIALKDGRRHREWMADVKEKLRLVGQHIE